MLVTFFVLLNISLNLHFLFSQLSTADLFQSMSIVIFIMLCLCNFFLEKCYIFSSKTTPTLLVSLRLYFIFNKVFGRKPLQLCEFAKCGIQKNIYLNISYILTTNALINRNQKKTKFLINFWQILISLAHTKSWNKGISIRMYKFICFAFFWNFGQYYFEDVFLRTKIVKVSHFCQKVEILIIFAI